MMEDNEIWKDIPFLKGYYQASNIGRIKSLKREKVVNQYSSETVLKQRKGRDGYMIVNISVDNKSKTYKVHRLVAAAFLENPQNLPQVNHKDENKMNNVVSNLEWCSSKYNNNYGTRIKRIVETRDNSESRHRMVVEQYTLEGEFINRFTSMCEASAKTGVHQGSISSALKKKRKYAGGFIWKHAQLK